MMKMRFLINAYTIKPGGSANTLIAENKDQPIWDIQSNKLSFLDLSYYHYADNSLKQIKVNGISNEVSGGSLSPIDGKYIVFEIGDENRKAGIAKTTNNTNQGEKLATGNVTVYEPRWSPVSVN